MEDLAAIAEINNLDMVKGKRTNKRRRITRLKTKLDDFNGMPLRELRDEDLTDLKHNLLKEIKLHNALQNRYESLFESDDPSEDAIAEELSTSDDVKDTHSQLLRRMETLINRRKHYIGALNIEREFQLFMDTADPSISQFEKDAIKIQRQINTYLQQTLSFAEDEELEPVRKKHSEHLIQLTKSLMDVLKKRAIEKKKPTADTDEDKPEHVTYHERSRFDVELPSFSGKPLDWQPFHDLFSTTLKSRGKHLNDKEKRCLLVKAMRDDEAKQVVLVHSQGEDGYNRAIQALINNHLSPTIVYPYHVRRTTVKEPLDFNREGFTKLRQRILLPYEAMKELKAATLSQYLVALAFEDFTPRMREEWTKHIASMSDLPTVEDLFAFTEPLEYKMAKIESSTSSPSSLLSIEKPHSAPANRKTSSTSHKTTVSKSQCNLCHEQHGLQRCPVFQGYDVVKRIKYVKDRRWCTNCLHPSYTCNNCQSSYTCKHCKQRHHSLLHRDEQDKSTTAVNCLGASPTLAERTTDEKVTVAPPTIAFLNTALVDAINGARNRRARIALDTGASSSLITESLASHLKLKRYPQHLLIEGAYEGGTSRHYVQANLRSIHDSSKSVTFRLSVVSKLPTTYPPIRKEDIATDPHLKDLQLADPAFGGPLDVLVGSLDCCKCLLGSFTYHTAPDIAVSPSIFGWTVTGPLDYQPPTQVLKFQLKEDPLHLDLQRMWELEKTPETPHLNADDKAALYHFQDTHQIEEDGRYKVRVPKTTDPSSFGESRHIAVKRFLQNERSLKKKDKLEDFNQALQEYVDLNHAEPVSHSDLALAPHYYLPVHGVFKETSTTTKVRPVFDASAKTSTGVSLNDTLQTGPNLYPLLTDVLIRFRSHVIGFSADISKMFREVLLHEEDRDLHRFLIRGEDERIADA